MLIKKHGAFVLREERMKQNNLSKIILSQIKMAAEAWEKIENDFLPADRWLSKFFYKNRKKIGARDRRFVSETIYSIFRNKTFLDFWTNDLFKEEKDYRKKKSCFFVISTAYKESFIDSNVFKQALTNFKIFVDEKKAEEFLAGIEKHQLPRGFEKLSEEEKIAAFCSAPLWLVKRWAKAFGDKNTEEIFRYFRERPFLTIRSNPLKIERKDLMRSLNKEGIVTEETKQSSVGIILKDRINVFNSELFKKGFFEVQDEGSQLICQMIEPKPGEVIWDVCAGGGGKSLLLAAMMKNKGRIIATDIRAYKLEDLKRRAKKAGVYNVFPADINRLNETKAAKKGFDKILVDAPCSGTGTLGRNPDMKWKLKEEWFSELHNKQIGIIEKALPYLKKNGKLYYVTCSIEELENEKVVSKILKEHSDLEINNCGFNGAPYFKLWPPTSRTDGFFMACFKKKGAN